MFDHSTITHFINRIGGDGFSEVFDGLNQELLRMGLLSPELYVDSSMVKANVNSYGLSRSGMTVEEFKEQAVEENGLFAIARSTVDDEGVEHEEVRYFQDAKGRLPLSPVDTDARWRTTRPGKPSGLNYQDNVVADGGVHRGWGDNPSLNKGMEGGSAATETTAAPAGVADGRHRLQRM